MKLNFGIRGIFFAAAGVWIFTAPVYAQVCVGYDQIAALVSAGANREKEKKNQSMQPSLQNPPVQRMVPGQGQRQYLGDGVYTPDNTKALQQEAYRAARAGVDQQPLPQTQTPQTSSGSGSSGVSWGTLAGMIPSGGGGKCRGICY